MKIIAKKDLFINDEIRVREVRLVGLDGEQVVLQGDVLEFPLPVPELLPVLVGDAEGLDGVEVIKGLHLKGHHAAVHFPGLLPVVPLLFDEEL